MKLNSIQEIIEDISQGKMVILMDDEDRENEGDLVLAAGRRAHLGAARPQGVMPSNTRLNCQSLGWLAVDGGAC